MQKFTKTEIVKLHFLINAINNGEASTRSSNSKRLLRKLGELALETGHLYHSFKAFRVLDDRRVIRKIGELALKEDSVADADAAFGYLNDRPGLLQALALAEKKDDYLDPIMDKCIGKKTTDEIGGLFSYWTSLCGFNDLPLPKLPNIMNMAYHLAGEYDIGVGIAKGGLYPAFIFSLYGLDSKIADAHGHSRGDTTFSWFSDVIASDFEGKDILVLDKDVVSGRTSKRVLDELLKFEPKSVELALVYSPSVEGGCGTNLSSVPEFQKVYFPSDFDISSFGQAIEKLEESLKKY